MKPVSVYPQQQGDSPTQIIEVSTNAEVMKPVKISVPKPQLLPVLNHICFETGK